jgi:hypothetical protein
MSLSTNARALVLAFGLTAGVPLAAQNAGIELLATPEYLRPDPFGGIVAPDKSGSDKVAPDKIGSDKIAPGDIGAGGFSGTLHLEGARGGYVSFHLIVKMSQPGPYTLSLNFDRDRGKLQADLFREWFHFTDSDKQYYPDALIPITLPYHSRLAEPDNRIAAQTAQAFWVDLWIPADAEPITYAAQAVLEAQRGSHRPQGIARGNSRR